MKVITFMRFFYFFTQRFDLFIRLIGKIFFVTERELIKGCVAGRRECQHALYEKYASSMMAICYRYTQNRDIASDLLHDGFIILFTQIKYYKFKGSFEGWIKRIFVTTALTYIRKNKKYSDTNSNDMVWIDDGSESKIIDRLSDNELLEKMEKLPDGYRTVLNMYAIEGYSHKEIGAELGIEEASSRSQFLRAKKLLKKLLVK